MKTRNVRLLACVLLGISASIEAAEEAPSVSRIPLDFVQAATDDKAGDYVRAQDEYLTLAAIGQAAADFNLGVMSLKGRSDPAAALGWFSAAHELGMKVPELAALQHDADDATQRRASAILAEYGKAAVINRLEDLVRNCALGGPPALANATTELTNTTWPTMAKLAGITHSYPHIALREGVQSMVLVTTVIDTDGHARDPRIEVAVPSEPQEGFQDEAIRLVLTSSYRSATRNGLPVAVRVAMPVKFSIADAPGFWDKKVLLQLRSKAMQGDPEAQMNVASVGMLDAKAKTLMSLSTDDEINLAVSAALGGSAAMQYWVANELRRASCHEEVAARNWLWQAAVLGYSLAQLELAQQGINDVGAVDPRAVVWLRRAANSQDPYVIKHVAWIMATSSAPSVRDPATALRLARQLPNKSSPNPELDTVLSAALAANGDFNGARAAMEQALNKARRLGWDEARLRTLSRTFADSHALQDASLVAAAEQPNLLRDGPIH